EDYFSDDFNGIRDRLVIEFLYTTGVRRAELISLKTQNVDLSSKTVKVLGKRNKERILPILNSVVPLILEYHEKKKQLNNIIDKEYFFLKEKGVKLYEGLVYRIINKYISGVSDKVKKSSDVLRHAFETNSITNGTDLN